MTQVVVVVAVSRLAVEVADSPVGVAEAVGVVAGSLFLSFRR